MKSKNSTWYYYEYQNASGQALHSSIQMGKMQVYQMVQTAMTYSKEYGCKLICKLVKTEAA